MAINSLKNNNGFTFVEILVSILIVSIVMLGVFGLIIFTLKITTDNSLRLMATALANQKVEYVRSLPYNSVGTLTGMVHGVITNDEIVAMNNAHFIVNYFIKYIDDPYDGLFPADVNNNDYKNIRIAVSYNGPFGPTSVIVYTIVAPRNLEVCPPGNGTLAIQVLNASGQPVPSANVYVENHALSPNIFDNGLTDQNGYLIYPCASSSDQTYQATTTKAGYSTDYTVATVDPNFHPRIPYASILDDAITTLTLQIDLLSNLVIKTIHASLPQNFIASHDTTGADQTNSRIAIDNSGNIYVVWQDYRQSTKAKIRAQKFNSSGTLQWDPTDPVIATMNDTVIPDIKADEAGNLYIAWDDDSEGNRDSFLTKLKSSDGSQVWTGEKKVVNLNSEQILPRISLTDDGSQATTTIIWQDNLNTDWDIYMKNYAPDGSEQWASEKRVNTDALGNGKNQYEPVIANDNNGNIFAAWTDDRNDNLDIYFAKYTSDSSLSWEYKANNDGGTTAQHEPDIAVNKNTNFVYAIWTDERNGNKDIYLQKFDPAGTKQWADDLPANTATISDQYSPSIAIDNSSNILYIIWTDNRNGNPDIYAQKLNGTDGAQMWTSDVRVNIDTDNSSQYNPNIVIDPTDSKPFATWYSDGMGNYDIYASKFDEYGAETNVGNVSLDIHGGKTLNLPPDTPNYKYNHTYTTDSVGNLNLNDIEWDSYYFTLPSVSTKHILMTDPVLPINLAPGTNQTVKIYLD